MLRNAAAVPVVLAISSLLTASISNPTREPVLLTGRITDARTGEPVQNVHIVLEGQTIGAVSGPEGEFRLPSNAEPNGVELTLYHPCYHTVRVVVGTRDVLEGTGRSGAPTRRIDLAMPFNYEKYVGYAPPLGGCR